jgi:hypothetical protein
MTYSNANNERCHWLCTEVSCNPVAWTAAIVQIAKMYSVSVRIFSCISEICLFMVPVTIVRFPSEKRIETSQTERNKFRDLCPYSVPYRDLANLRIALQRVVYTQLRI